MDITLNIIMVHGKNNSCYNFYNFTLLSFLMHQIHQLTDSLFQKLRLKYSRLASLWHQVGAFVNRLAIDNRCGASFL